MWHDGKDHQPPNNWQSIFVTRRAIGTERGQFYYHAFYKEQPTWTGETEVRNAMYDELRFWMKKGVAGFRWMR